MRRSRWLLYIRNGIAWVLFTLVLGMIFSGKIGSVIFVDSSSLSTLEEIETTALFYTESPRALEAYYELVKDRRR